MLIYQYFNGLFMCSLRNILQFTCRVVVVHTKAQYTYITMASMVLFATMDLDILMPKLFVECLDLMAGMVLAK